MIGLILAAAGSGSRFGIDTPKQFLRIGKTPVYLLAFASFSSRVSETVIVVPSAWCASVRREVESSLSEFPVRVVEGGTRRQDSVYRGLLALKDEMDMVLVHDAARPFVSGRLVDRVIQKTRVGGACVPAVPVSDTIKEVELDQVSRTLERTRLRHIQTPQGFHRILLLRAFEKAGRENFDATDEASLVENLGEKVYTVEGEPSNRKINWKEDLEENSEGLIAKEAERDQPAVKPSTRIGCGFDFHSFETGRPLILGGVAIPHPQGLAGHSDADVLLHAVCDALLGAAGLPDIGAHFPDTDPQYRGVSSLVLLEKVFDLIRQKGLAVVNIDLVIVAEDPRIGPYVSAIRSNLCRILDLSATEVGIKATTMEGKGAIGRGEGVAVQATALLYSTGAQAHKNS